MDAGASAATALPAVTADGIRRAMRRWHQPDLGRVELAGELQLVRDVLSAEGRADAVLARGEALRQVLRRALGALGDRGFGEAAGLLLRQYIRQEPFMLIASDMAVAERGFFRRQGQALETLSEVLAEMEQAAREGRDASTVLAGPSALPGAPRHRASADAPEWAALPVPQAATTEPQAAESATPPQNLPRPLSSFVGRRRQIDEVVALIGQSRLVSLVGPGGCGKTRLALAVASELVHGPGAEADAGRRKASAFTHGVWWVDLAALADPALVAKAVANVLGVREVPGEPTEAAVTAHLEARTLLLVLDNCEHLVSACAELAGRWLGAGPGLRILATSRESLELVGEQVWPVPTLTLPDLARLSPADVDRVSRSEAVQLFIERAALVRPGFHLTPENAPVVGRICLRLDGLPLALELASARTKLLSVEQILARLDDRFRLLAGGGRSAEPRQQTMRAAIDWSFLLLSEAERRLFARLAVFQGGWTLEAAEAVASGGPVEVEAIMDLLGLLVNKSLARAVDVGGSARYSLLETVREYALERLNEYAERDALADRHLAWCVAFAGEAERRLPGPERPWQLDRFEVEHENLRSALTWCRLSGELVNLGLRLASAAHVYWFTRGRDAEGRRMLDELLALPADPPDPAVRATALVADANLHWLVNDFPRARELVDEAVAIARALGDERRLAAALDSSATVAAHGERDSVRAMAQREESLALFRAAGDRASVALVLDHLGADARRLGDYAAARRWLGESLSLSRENGDHYRVAYAIGNLGGILMNQGQVAEARALFDEGLALMRQLGDLRGSAWIAKVRGAIALYDGDFQAARRYFEECVSLWTALQWPASVARGHVLLASVAEAEGDTASAKALYREGLDVLRASGEPLDVVIALIGLGNVALQGGALEEAAHLLLEGVAAVGVRRTEGSLAALTAALDSFAQLALAGGDPELAARLLAACNAARDPENIPLASRQQYRRAVEAVRSRLDEADFAASWSGGTALGLDGALGLAALTFGPEA